jgi:hypothetical protein
MIPAFAVEELNDDYYWNECHDACKTERRPLFLDLAIQKAHIDNIHCLLTCIRRKTRFGRHAYTVGVE